MFVCASAGNHAQGVAYMPHGISACSAVIFMPVTTPQQKIDQTQHLRWRCDRPSGWWVTISTTPWPRRTEPIAPKCRRRISSSPFNDADVVEGQASVAVEIETQLGGLPDHVVMPVGGGGLSSGIRSYFGAEQAMTLVEPSGGACLHAALAAGKPVRLDHVDNFADGAAVAQIGNRPFARLSDLNPTQLSTLSEDRLCITMLELLNVEGIVLEPAGALAVDALKDIAHEIRGKTVVCVTSGGNFDFERLPEVKERAQRYAGLKKYFVLRMPQRPGALKDFLAILGPDDDIARFEYLKKSARNFGSVLIGIETTNAENFQHIQTQMLAAGFEYRDITNDQVLAEFLI